MRNPFRLSSHELEEKAVKVIESCTTRHQLDIAIEYVNLFFKKTNDINYYRHLIQKLNEKIDQLAQADS